MGSETTGLVHDGNIPANAGGTKSSPKGEMVGEAPLLSQGLVKVPGGEGAKPGGELETPSLADLVEVGAKGDSGAGVITVIFLNPIVDLTGGTKLGSRGPRVLNKRREGRWLVIHRHPGHRSQGRLGRLRSWDINGKQLRCRREKRGGGELGVTRNGKDTWQERE